MSSPSVLHWHWPPTSLTTGASLHWSTWRTTSQSHRGTFRQGTSTSPTCQLSVIESASHPYFPESLSGEGEFQSNFFWHSSDIFGQMWGLSFLLQELAVEFCLLSLEKEVYDLYKSKEINSPSCYDLKDLTTINDDEEDSKIHPRCALQNMMMMRLTTGSSLRNSWTGPANQFVVESPSG